jgi:acyl-CoA reductase-like NAD-dependent aldehyde dehydrogenase
LLNLPSGGNDPAIVCKNVDIAATAPKIASLAFMNSGQICLALKRIYVHEDIYDQFRDAAVQFTKSLKSGEGNEEGVFLGPVQNKMQFEKVKTFFSDIEKEKWNVAVGGKNEDKPGYFITPTIIDRPAEDSRIVTEEPFGPIVPFLSWKDEEEVIVRANNTKMGLGASVWSTDLDQAARIARQLEAGSVWVNTHLEVSPNAPFGGHKESGVGYEWSKGGMMAFCNVQSLFLKKV